MATRLLPAGSLQLCSQHSCIYLTACALQALHPRAVFVLSNNYFILVSNPMGVALIFEVAVFIPNSLLSCRYSLNECIQQTGRIV